MTSGAGLGMARLTNAAKIRGASAIGSMANATQKHFKAQNRKRKGRCAICCMPVTRASTSRLTN
jgi:hypothetical protein